MAPEEPGPAPLMKERPNHWERVGVCHAVSVSNRVKAADVARLAGVSRTAVSLVLNGRAEGNIAPATAERVRAAAQELGYTPDRVAQSLRLQRTHVIGLVTDAIATSPFAGRVLAGAVCGTAEFINGVLLPYQRNTGCTLSPFNAWIVLKGLETLELRAVKQAENALEVARFLEARVPVLNHPGLPSHPQHELVKRQMRLAGSVFSFEVDGGREAAHKVLDALEMIDISNNIGDTKSLMTHPSSTTHSSLTPETRALMGVNEGMLRISVGLEDPADVMEDLDQALRTIGL